MTVAEIDDSCSGDFGKWGINRKVNYSVMTEISFYMKNQLMDLYDMSITKNHSVTSEDGYFIG